VQLRLTSGWGRVVGVESQGTGRVVAVVEMYQRIANNVDGPVVHDQSSVIYW